MCVHIEELTLTLRKVHHVFTVSEERVSSNSMFGDLDGVCVSTTLKIYS